jgi:Ser/Thr protein kinase RdoA (MazF antagonist)
MEIDGTAELAAVLATAYGLELAEAPLLLTASAEVRVWQITTTAGQWVARVHSAGDPNLATLGDDLALYAGLRGQGVAAPDVLPAADGEAIRWLGGLGLAPALVVTRAERLRPVALPRNDADEAQRACAALGRAVAGLHTATARPELAPLFPHRPPSGPASPAMAAYLDGRELPGALLTPAGLHGGLAGGQRLWLPGGQLYIHDLAGRCWGPAVCDLADLALWCGGDALGRSVPWAAWRGRVEAVLCGYTALRPLTPLDRRALLPMIVSRASALGRHAALVGQIMSRSAG